MKKLSFAVAAMAALMTSCCQNQPVDPVDAKVNALYEKMSQEERIAQLRSCFITDFLDSVTGELDTSLCRQLIPHGIGHFSQFMSQRSLDPNTIRDLVAQLQDWLMNNTPNGIPALFHEEVLSGVNTQGATIYPQQIGQAGSFNPVLAELKTTQTGMDMRQIGGVLSLSPMVDVCRTPSFNRLEESYGEDAYLSAVMGTAFVRGLQQGDLRYGVGTCSKHYLGYGGGGDADEKELMEEILLPHETMIRLAGSKVVMTGYHAVHGTNCVANEEIIEDILRGYVGFDGMMVSDYTAIDQIPGLENTLQRAAASINAGNDVDFPTGSNYALLQECIDKGLVKQSALERAVKNVLKHKCRAGLFEDHPYLYSNKQILLDSPAERQTAYDIASQSVVLLQNNGILPLTSGKRVLLTGPNANSMWAMCGDYSFPAMNYFWKMVIEDGEHPHIVGLREGMENSKPSGLTLQYSRGCDWTDTIETKLSNGGDERAWDYKILHRKVDSGEKADAAEALRMAKSSDVIIAAMGENVMLCGENRDRQGLALPGQQEAYVESLLATGKPVVLVLFGGRAMPISKFSDRCAAILHAWYPGEEGGNAVADILYGKVNPSAKLSVSYPNTEVYEPICYNYAKEQDPRVQWPFGYGLSYTSFEYANLQMPAQAATGDESIEFTFEITNTGKVAGEDVAQIYLSPATADQHIRPIQLQGFARVALQPGETKTVHTKLYVEQLGYYSNEGKRQWNIEAGDFVIQIGHSSQELSLNKSIKLEGKKVTKPLRDFYFSESIAK